MSMSGICLRPGFKNRSNSRSYLIGSMSTMRRQYATHDPAALPRPGPTRMPRDFAYRTRSHTTRKYAENPIDLMTSSSNSIRSITCSGGVPPLP